jgi:hypothetical protein
MVPNSSKTETAMTDTRPHSSGMIVDSAVGSTSIDEFIEILLDWFTKKYGTSALTEAREEFFWKFGKVFDDDTFFHQRMTFFIDYLLFIRPVSYTRNSTTSLITPFEIYGQETPEAKIPFTFTKHSIYEVVRIRDGFAECVDFLVERKLRKTLKLDEKCHALRKGDLFQGIIFENANTTASYGIILHPSESIRLIKKFLRNECKRPDIVIEEVLAKLAKIHLKAERHAHVKPKKIYTELST